MSNFSINEGSVSAVRQEKITYKDKDDNEHTITETTIKPSKSGAMAGAAAQLVDWLAVLWVLFLDLQIRKFWEADNYGIIGNFD